MFFSNKIISRQKSWGDLVQPQITEYYIVIPAKQLIQFLQHPFERNTRKAIATALVKLGRINDAEAVLDMPRNILPAPTIKF